MESVMSAKATHVRSANGLLAHFLRARFPSATNARSIQRVRRVEEGNSQREAPEVMTMPSLYLLLTTTLFIVASFAMTAVQRAPPRRRRTAEREEQTVAMKKKMRALTAPVISAARAARDPTWRESQHRVGQTEKLNYKDEQATGSGHAVVGARVLEGGRSDQAPGGRLVAGGHVCEDVGEAVHGVAEDGGVADTVARFLITARV
jgi:hypothetical protein